MARDIYEPLSQEGNGENEEIFPSHANTSSSTLAAVPENGRAKAGISPSIRPPTYYGEGPFDPPSSDDEDAVLIEKNGPVSPGTAERGDIITEVSSPSSAKRKRPAPLQCLIICLGSLILTAVIIGVFAARGYSGITYRIHGAKKLTIENIFNGTFSVETRGLAWVAEAGDGVFSTMEDGVIRLVDINTNTTRDLVVTSDVKDEDDIPLRWTNWWLSPDMRYILFKADSVKQWRSSSFGNYYVHNLESGVTHPLTAPSDPPVTAFATWSPTGESIVYVENNDIYILTSPSPSTSPIRVTNTGNASLFNGVPDWVYEEEVFSSDFTLWWSPDSAKLAFLRLDETDVPEYTFPVYNPSADPNRVVPYTGEITIKYPKPGFPNPVVSAHVFDVAAYLADPGTVVAGVSAEAHTLDLDWAQRHPANESIVFAVSWVGDATLIVKEVNRNADDGNVVLFDLTSRDNSLRAVGQVVRKLGKNGEENDDGWIDSNQNIRAIPTNLTADGQEAYLDIVPDAQGWNHVALFSPATSSTPYFLTSGEWEVTAQIAAVDVGRGLVYFHAARPASTHRNIYSVPLPTDLALAPPAPAELTDASAPAIYKADFSPGAGFYVLDYKGPGIPWQRVVQVDNSSFDYLLADNAALNETWTQYEAPVVTYGTIENEGYELNYREIRPPRMDDSGRTKYPVLFQVYGGPGSQLVDISFGREWADYAACGLQYVYVVVDGRGTGYKGRKFRNVVKGDLGFWETRDQVFAAKLWAAKEYVDPTRIGIWGWSYGGFMASKVLEADAGVHSLGIAVAPVTSWLLYDSIYTERYMDVPWRNPGGYVNASVTNVSGFADASFLLMHGSGDDNVHFANSAHLLDMLTAAQVRNFRFRMFTDSAHSMSRRGAYRELYEYMTGFLVEKWGKGGRRRGW